jgi:hypothetical protein
LIGEEMFVPTRCDPDLNLGAIQKGNHFDENSMIDIAI